MRHRPRLAAAPPWAKKQPVFLFRPLLIANPEQHTYYQDTEIKQLLILTSVYAAPLKVCSGPDFSRDSAGGAEERDAPQPEGIDGARRAWRRLSLLHKVSTMALMKALHQKITGYCSS